ncbi:hypothetical protein, partial [Spirosoma utsteinense]|uniref:hypothetical protein n=1 Tax=Spirosoma utsteinense TaxID=2585773 RepID=UPI001646070D
RRKGGKEERRKGGKEERRKGGKEERRKGGKEERRKGGKEEGAGASFSMRQLPPPFLLSSFPPFIFLPSK